MCSLWQHHLVSTENMSKAFTGECQKLLTQAWMENPKRTLKESHTGTFYIYYKESKSSGSSTGISQSILYSPTKTNTSVRVTRTALQARSAPQFVKTHILVTALNAQAQTVLNSTNNSYWNTVQNNVKKTKPYFIPNKHLTIGIHCLLSIETAGYTQSSSSTLVLVFLELSTLLSELCTCIYTGPRQTHFSPTQTKTNAEQQHSCSQVWSQEPASSYF